MSRLLLLALRPLAILYGSLQMLRRLAYSKGWLTAHKLPGFTISVGNLEAGGTGKSPVVIALAQKLLEDGYSPVIVTRGYRSGLKSQESLVLMRGEVILGRRPANFYADEAKMQSTALPSTPIIIGAKRAMGIQLYLEKFPPPSHWILDDGFQHLQIARDFDLVLLDYEKPLHNGWPLPSGHLREWPLALKWASALLLTRAASEQTPEILASLSDAKPLFFSKFTSENLTHRAGPNVPITPSSKIFLVAGIAKPRQLEKALIDRGLKVGQRYWAKDHRNFSIDELCRNAKDCEVLVTTEKDYHRNPDIFLKIGISVYVISLRADIDALFNSPEFRKVL